MGTCLRLGSVRYVRTVVCVLCLILILLAPTSVQAQGDLGYSFEGELQGWETNGHGIVLTHDLNSVGATEGNDAMKIEFAGSCFFCGVFTENRDPNDLAAPGGPSTFPVDNPPGFDHVIFDITIPDPNAFIDAGGTFLSLGIFMFGETQGGQPSGDTQFQNPDPNKNNEIFLHGGEFPGSKTLPAGTHQLVFTLDYGVHPITFEEGVSFRDVYGPPSADPNNTDAVMTGFYIYVNKSFGPEAEPWEVIIDNIRFADAIPGDFNKGNITNADLVVDGNDFLAWQRGETRENGSQAELAMWEANYGSVVALAAAASTAAVPEPTSVALFGVCVMILSSGVRHRIR
jgi:hypothetical protein